ncbi:hypothetical protein [Actinokineospora sp. NBRC 105648]|uniref:hypothetical protein n=1 Tax=Actinokineospora sp. NBRC 105648 TaxID=3032206 RepID=UPI00249F9BD6|nr:hypothetical protein [Actinokineospora sp. NBRC 105648]GLZ42356.1 hypothetical protein Acsp05_59800 [Actinokineospora sp. NBRC 105648]
MSPKILTRVAPAALLALAVAVPFTAGTAEAAARGPLVSAEILPLPADGTGGELIALNSGNQIAGAVSFPTGPRHVALWKGAAVTDLGVGSPSGINDRGQVVGTDSVVASGSYERTPKIWFRGKTTVITTPHKGYFVTSGINSTGLVPLASSSSPYGYHLERLGVWSNGTYTPLNGNGPELSLNVVTDNGLTAGALLPRTGTGYAYSCTAGTCTPLPTLPGATGFYRVSAANESGVLVGTVGSVGVRWSGGQVTALPAVAGATSATVASGPQAINESGDVVGESGPHAALWRGGQAIDLGSPLGGRSAAVAVSDAGDVLGWTESPDGTQRHAFLWRAGTATDLGSAGAPKAYPVAINDHGVIIGNGYTADYRSLPLRWKVRPVR